MESITARFAVTEDATRKTLVTFTKKPPVGAPTVYLIGNQDHSWYDIPLVVWLVDNPPSAPDTNYV